ncbi:MULTISPECIES: ABC-F family ATP-binding cassette domain-containing protein [unclassified Janthinobacterium]|uniref:ABC-F family ATP-binding cassette domain-containing protein n=1 Tax=unclassified Janthinobacterium TaxID=2610881 RepID=UPI001615F226|nr:MULTISPECIES: ABC-F family ATP-binding cassette domain-containing protein [unclassified Janthinobacterium]MBB5370488.1 heme-transporting ATPase [Janthinobacterium sp. K2C7]MBB5383298.1 heme-transporting ATPase [Janthinobacterium sp. K2Li3]MBB5388752.1 heme-transporting ATPase [Janthinobacterium sp. K2E3]
MTTLISTLALHLESHDGFLFTELAFTLRQGDRIGLIGHNGCGKSTLLGLLSGKREATSGSIHTARACRLQHVEQHLPAGLASLSLYDALLAPVLDRPEWHWRVDSLLAELGFDAATAQVPVHSLSGGQHTRLLLGRALLQEPNVLLLDEPSNHLDLPSLLWLERFLAQWRGALILVSHDQRLLDNVTTRSWILRDGRIYDFELPCGPALTALAEADVAAAARHAAEQKEIDRLAVSSKRLAVWGQVYDNENLARKAKTMQRRIAKLKDEQAFVSDGAPWRLSLRGKALAAKQLLVLDALAVRAVPQSPVLFHVGQLWLKPGDRVALLGANGSGKSSLLRLCWQAMQAGEEDQRLDLRFHRAANVGYYDQSLQQLADEADLSDALYPFAVQNEVSRSQLARRQALISAGFGYARHGQKVATLSGGERARLLFLGLSLASYHLLLLDEPSNHLDMQGKAELGWALQGFEGGCLLVSHDRDLIETACNRFWVVADGKLEEWPDAPSAYARLSTADGVSPAPQPSKQAPVLVPVQSEVDLQLERLCELEQLLAEDLARKPRHQKLASQRVWREELDQLNRALGISA